MRVAQGHRQVRTVPPDDRCLPLAQRLAEQQLTTDWPAALTEIARSINPLHDVIFEPSPMDCCWSAYQTEWATDVMFRDPSALAALYPALVKQATHHFASPDVMRFLGRKVHGNFTGELTGSFKRRPEGVRVKHCLNGNSIKMYDKGGSVLRVAARIGHRLRILRAHGLIKKIPRSHRHRLTSKGQLLTAALSATRNATIKQLLRDAA